MKIWAISDLHLGISTGKWMDRFGEHWTGHHLKVERAWRERVEPQDIVLLPGDLSWAMKPRDVLQDLEWLAALPGRKVLIKGNHDYWWPGSQRKLEELLPPGIHAIKKRALLIDGIPIVGVRGADFLPKPAANGVTPAMAYAEATEQLARERRELLFSIEHLRALSEGAAARFALFHYPPFRGGSSESAFTRMLEDAGCRHCVFGHLHSATEWDRIFQGERNGVTYRLVSCDALGFEPALIETVG